VTNPVGGATVSGDVILLATATDGVGVVGVQFYVDGVPVGTEDTALAYSRTWTSTGSSNGTHTILARARDAAGNHSTSSPITVTVSNAGGGGTTDTTPPTATITAPTASQVLSSGTTQTTLTVTTNENATCRFNSTDIAYSPSTGTAFTTTGGTTHSTSLTGLSNGTSYTRYVRCADTAGNAMTTSQSISFSVAAAAGGGGGGGGGATSLIFNSDWGIAGTSNTVMTDNGAWNYYAGANGSIVSASSLGLTNWPTSNAYVVQINTSAARKLLGDPVPGETRYFRYYLQVLYNNTHGAADKGMLEHGVESVDAELGGGDGFNPYRIPRNDGTWFPGYREISSGYRYVADQLSLLKNRTYRIEWAISYGATTYSIQYRIYDENGVLVADEDDFHRYLPTETQSVTLGSENFTYTPLAHRYLSIGTNGPGSNYPLTNSAGDNQFAHGAVCVRNDTWCGPYSGSSTGTGGGSQPPSDTTPPTVSITAPTASATVSGSSVTVSANASDAVGVSGVQFLLDGSNLGSEDTTSPYSITWDSTTASNASHTITARARDAAGNTTVSSGVSVTVSNSVGGGGGGGITWTPRTQVDWGTALGNTDSALTDGNRLTIFSANAASNSSVISAPSGEGFRTANVLQMLSPTGVRSGWIELGANLGVIAIGEVRNFRIKVSNHHPSAAQGATDHSHHAIQDGYPSGAGTYQNWNLTDGTNFANEWEPNILITNGGGGRYYLGSAAFGASQRLSKGVAYTFEFQMYRVDANSFRFDAWVYDSSGNLLYSPSDWKSGTYSGETLASNRSYTFNNLNGTQSWNVGLNGTDGTWPIYHSSIGEMVVVSSLDNPSLTEGTAIGSYGSVLGE